MASLRKAVNEFCKGCIYDKADNGTWRDQVEKCKCTGCPLYEHRPRTMGTIIATRAANREAADAAEDGDEDETVEAAITA